MSALPEYPTERDRERFRDITKAMRFGLEYDRRLATNGDYTDQQTVAMYRLWWSVERERQLLQNLNQSQGCKISELLERAEKAEAELAMMAKQEPVAFWWIGEGGENHGGPYRGMASEFSIDNARNSGCSPQYLYAGPVPAVAAGLPAIGPYRDFIPAPAVPDWNVNIERIRDVMHMMGISIEESVECFSAALPTNINRMTLAMKRHLQKLAGMTAAPAPSVPEEWREVMTELADDLAIEIDQSYPPERRAYPSEQRRYEGEMAIVNRARALLQSADHSDLNLENVAPDCRTCANRGRVNGLSQESYCDSCVYQGRDWRQNHFVDINKMVDAVKRRCEACAILPCSCK